MITGAELRTITRNVKDYEKRLRIKQYEEFIIGHVNLDLIRETLRDEAARKRTDCVFKKLDIVKNCDDYGILDINHRGLSTDTQMLLEEALKWYFLQYGITVTRSTNTAEVNFYWEEKQ